MEPSATASRFSPKIFSPDWTIIPASIDFCQHTSLQRIQYIVQRRHADGHDAYKSIIGWKPSLIQLIPRSPPIRHLLRNGCWYVRRLTPAASPEHFQRQNWLLSAATGFAGWRPTGAACSKTASATRPAAGICSTSPQVAGKASVHRRLLCLPKWLAAAGGMVL